MKNKNFLGAPAPVFQIINRTHTTGRNRTKNEPEKGICPCWDCAKERTRVNLEPDRIAA